MPGMSVSGTARSLMWSERNGHAGEKEATRSERRQVPASRGLCKPSWDLGFLVFMSYEATGESLVERRTIGLVV